MMSRWSDIRRIGGIGLLLWTLGSTVGNAQELPDPSTASFHAGPFGFIPTLAIVDMGSDSNVFNDATNAEQDLTATLQPSLDTLFHAGLARGRIRSSVGFVYFKQFANQRAVNTAQDAFLAVQFHRIRPFGRITYLNTQDRPSIEIDTRVRRKTAGVGAGVDLALTPRLVVRAEAGRHVIDFDEDATFEDTNLQQALNETVVDIAGSLRYELTPLTRLVLLVQPRRDTFAFSPARDSRSLRIGPAFEFAPTALISGSVFVGVRKFNVLDARVSDFNGLVGSLDLNYVLRGSTQFAFRSNRDIAYSYESTRPYYVQTDIGLTVTKRLTRALDVSGFGTRQLLDYKTLRIVGALDGPAADVPSTKRATIVGAGAGYRLGDRATIGFQISRAIRPADLYSEAHSVRVFTAVTYGF